MRSREIQTRSGRFIDVFDPDPSAICIEDIAHGLAFKCRFAGHTSRYYSVAQHSVSVSLLLRQWGCGVSEQISGLLHDAAEAYCGDVPTPVKSCLPEYMEMEDHLQAVIFDKFGLSWPLPVKVKDADHIMLHQEAYMFMRTPQGNAPDWCNDIQRIGGLFGDFVFDPLEPFQAFDLFMFHFNRLQNAQ